MSKARGYVLEDDKSGKLFYFCHKGCKPQGLPFFIKSVDPVIYKDYLKELLLAQGKPYREFTTPKATPVAPKAKSLSKGLTKLSSLPPDHEVRKYVDNRLIPSSKHYRLFFAREFKTMVNDYIPDKFDPQKIGKDEPRLVLPFITRYKKLFGLQGRSLDPKNDIRYITIMIDTQQPRLFGLESIDMKDDIIVLEGPIDSLFIRNGIASAGGNIESELGNADLPKEKIVVVYDNEPRSTETNTKITKAIKLGYRVCIWPNQIKEKDVNDMVISMVGEHKSETNILKHCEKLRSLIIKNSYEGMEALLKLAEWRKG